MRRTTLILFLLSIAAGFASVIVVATAPNSNPTPSDSLWGHQMPTTQAWIDLALIASSAVLGGTAGSLRFGRRRLLAASAFAVTSAVGLYFVSVIVWRLHAPSSAGNL
jgi:hypothetical protein